MEKEFIASALGSDRCVRRIISESFRSGKRLYCEEECPAHPDFSDDPQRLGVMLEDLSEPGRCQRRSDLFGRMAFLQEGDLGPLPEIGAVKKGDLGSTDPAG